MDDEIIYSWFFNFVECFDSTLSATIIVLVEELESFSSLKSQHGHGLVFGTPFGPNLNSVSVSVSVHLGHSSLRS